MASGKKIQLRTGPLTTDTELFPRVKYEDIVVGDSPYKKVFPEVSEEYLGKAMALTDRSSEGLLTYGFVEPGKVDSVKVGTYRLAYDTNDRSVELKLNEDHLAINPSKRLDVVTNPRKSSDYVITSKVYEPKIEEIEEKIKDNYEELVQADELESELRESADKDLDERLTTLRTDFDIKADGLDARIDALQDQTEADIKDLRDNKQDKIVIGEHSGLIWRRDATTGKRDLLGVHNDGVSLVINPGTGELEVGEIYKPGNAIEIETKWDVLKQHDFHTINVNYDNETIKLRKDPMDITSTGTLYADSKGVVQAIADDNTAREELTKAFMEDPEAMINIATGIAKDTRPAGATQIIVNGIKDTPTAPIVIAEGIKRTPDATKLIAEGIAITDAAAQIVADSTVASVQVNATNQKDLSRALVDGHYLVEKDSKITPELEAFIDDKTLARVTPAGLSHEEIRVNPGYLIRSNGGTVETGGGIVGYGLKTNANDLLEVLHNDTLEVDNPTTGELGVVMTDKLTEDAAMNLKSKRIPEAVVNVAKAIHENDLASEEIAGAVTENANAINRISTKLSGYPLTKRGINTDTTNGQLYVMTDDVTVGFNNDGKLKGLYEAGLEDDRGAMAYEPLTAVGTNGITKTYVQTDTYKGSTHPTTRIFKTDDLGNGQVSNAITATNVNLTLGHPADNAWAGAYTVDVYKDEAGTGNQVPVTLTRLLPPNAGLQHVGGDLGKAYNNPLADRDFVISSISSALGTSRGTFSPDEFHDGLYYLNRDFPPGSSLAENNDYAFVIEEDSEGNRIFNRYKCVAVDKEAVPQVIDHWEFEYTVGNTTFTPEQLAAINSGVVEQDVENLRDHINDKNNPHEVKMSDLSDLTPAQRAAILDVSVAPAQTIAGIKQGLVQVINSNSRPYDIPSARAVYDTLNTSYEKLSNKVTSLSASSTNNQYPSAKAVYDGLNGKEDKANKIDALNLANPSTVKYPSEKAVADAFQDKSLLTTTISAASTDAQYPSAKAVYDAISGQGVAGKEDKSNKVTSVTAASTDTQYPSAKAVYNLVNGFEESSNKTQIISPSTTASSTLYPSEKAVADALDNYKKRQSPVDSFIDGSAETAPAKIVTRVKQDANGNITVYTMDNDIPTYTAGKNVAITNRVVNATDVRYESGDAIIDIEQPTTIVAGEVNTGTITHVESGVTAGAYGEAYSATPIVLESTVNSVNIPNITVNATGHITDAKNTTVQIKTMTGATATAAGKIGLVPQPGAGDRNKMLFGDGTWKKPRYYTVNLAATFTGGNVTVTGIEADDTPIVDVVTSGDIATRKEQVKAWGKVLGATTSANTINFVTDGALGTAITVSVLCA